MEPRKLRGLSLGEGANWRLSSVSNYVELAEVIRDPYRCRTTLDDLKRGAFATAGNHSFGRRPHETERVFVWSTE